jgi:hypothetical protein
MAESNHHSSREPAAAHSMPTQQDEPLAGLARLIDETVTMNDLASDLRRPKPADSRSARELNLTAQHGYAASDVLQETSEVQYSTPAPVNHDFYPLDDSSDSDDGRCEPSSHADSSGQSRSASYEHEPQWHPDAEDLQASSDGGYDEHEDQSQNQSDDHTYGEDYEEDSNSPRRGKFIFVAAVLGVALLGTGAVFGYRALFADSIVPSLPSIIKAEGGPNMIIPTSRDPQGTVSPQSDVDNGVSSERLEAREEWPLDVPPVTTAPQPGMASVLSPMAQPSPAARVDSFNSPPVAPSPTIPGADQAPPPDAPTVTPASPAKQGPEKTRIRMDQPNTADSAATQPQSVPVRPTAEQQATKPSDANGPLSIVPSSNDAANAAPGSTRTAPPERSAALAKPAATEITSKAPAASGGDYAVQVLSQHNEEEVQSSFRALQAKYPKLLGGREPMVRRADLGAKGVYYRAMVGPFVSAKGANELCLKLKAAGGSCIIQKN